MASKSFNLKLAFDSDIETLVEVYFKANPDDPLLLALYKGMSWDARVNSEASRVRKAIEECPWVKLFKMTETKTGKIVGMSLWQFRRPPGRAIFREEFPEELWGDGVNFKSHLLNDIREKMESHLYEKIYNENWYGEYASVTCGVATRQSLGQQLTPPVIDSIAVLPEYQNRGLGTRLMTAGLDEADRSRGKAFLCTTSKDGRLFEKLNFIELDGFEVDVSRFGVEEQTEVFCLKREPAKEKQWAVVDVCGVPFRIEHD